MTPKTAISLPINDLKRHNAPLMAQIQQAAAAVLARGWYILGPQCERFETEFAAFCGVGHAIGVGNGTDALELGLRAFGIGPGASVVTVANAGGYSTAAIRAVGADPLYADVDLSSMLLDTGALTRACAAHPAAIIVTHLYGRMADMPAVLEIAGKTGIPVIEDCAQAHGASLHGRPAGSWGRVGCFSFYPTKNLGALGDAGILTTGDGELASRIRRFRQYGWTSKYRSGEALGRNSRLDEVQASMLSVKLPHLPAWNERRRAIASAYNALLSCDDIEVPGDISDAYVAHLYVIRSARREHLRAALAQKGIGTEVHYPIPDYLQDPVRQAPWAQCRLAATERCCNEALTLPCFPEMTNAEVEYVAESVRRALA